MSLNENLRKAKRQKKDEFYTRLSDIENELRHYTGHFPGKVVYCNCDDPRVSKFFHYFSYNFERLGLKKLITACYRNKQRDMFSRHDSERAIWLEYKGNAKGGREPDIEDIGVREFNGDGDFRSAESIELLKRADIVVTNPPFSLFRQYVAQLMEHSKRSRGEARPALDRGSCCCRRLSPLAGASISFIAAFPHPRSSNRTCGFPASRLSVEIMPSPTESPGASMQGK